MIITEMIITEYKKKSVFVEAINIREIFVQYMRKRSEIAI